MKLCLRALILFWIMANRSGANYSTRHSGEKSLETFQHPYSVTDCWNSYISLHLQLSEFPPKKLGWLHYIIQLISWQLINGQTLPRNAHEQFRNLSLRGLGQLKVFPVVKTLAQMWKNSDKKQTPQLAGSAEVLCLSITERITKLIRSTQCNKFQRLKGKSDFVFRPGKRGTRVI